MKTENWIQIICAGIGLIIVIQIFLLTITFSMKGRIGYFEGMPTRINDIAEALRDRGIFLAREEIIRPFETALITTKPVEVSPGNWMSLIHVMDTQNLQRTTYEVKIDGPDDKALRHRLTGITYELDETALQFYKLSQFSSEIGEPTPLPTYIDGNFSFVFHMTPAKFIEEFKVPGAIPKRYPITSKLDTWTKLVKEIELNSGTYAFEIK